MFHQYQQMVIFVTVQLLDMGLLILPKSHTILDPRRKQKTIMNFIYREVKSKNLNFITVSRYTVIMFRLPVIYKMPSSYQCCQQCKAKGQRLKTTKNIQSQNRSAQTTSYIRNRCPYGFYGPN